MQAYTEMGGGWMEHVPTVSGMLGTGMVILGQAGAAAGGIGGAGGVVTPPAGGEDLTVLWAILLLGVALVLFFMEVFVPSGGILGFCAAVAMISGVVLFFKVSTTLGLISAIISLSAIPFLFAFALKMWPHTPIARFLTLENQSKHSTDGGGDADGAIQSLVGKHGKALTDLHPVGTCLIDGKKMDCLAQHGMILSGVGVRVVSVDGLGVKVRQDDEAEN